MGLGNKRQQKCPISSAGGDPHPTNVMQHPTQVCSPSFTRYASLQNDHRKTASSRPCSHFQSCSPPSLHSQDDILRHGPESAGWASSPSCSLMAHLSMLCPPALFCLPSWHSLPSAHVLAAKARSHLCLAPRDYRLERNVRLELLVRANANGC